MKKFICMGILVLMAVFSAVPAYAAAEVVQDARTQGVITPQYTYISLLNAGLSINSSGKANCIGLASAYDASHTTKLTVELQKSSASGWSTIKSWSASSTGTYVADVYEDYYVVYGTYRVCATAKVYNASGTLLENKSAYSDTVTY
jgi:hypothetical protein